MTYTMPSRDVLAAIEMVLGAKMPQVVPTGTAARLLGRQPQTLRRWACLENGPIRPVKVGGRLAWKIEDINRLLKVEGIDATDQQA